MPPINSDSSELEVTPLDPKPREHSRRSAAILWLRSRPGRMALSALTLIIILGALAGILVRSSPDPLGSVQIALGYSTPTPTPFIPPGGDTFGLANWVPWGDLRIDGHAPTLTTIAPIGQGFTLPRGVHHLMYQARYFATLSCAFSVPQAIHDTCPLANSAGMAGGIFQRILDLRATPQRLALEQYKSLLSTISATLSAYSFTTAIEPDERYVNQAGQVETAQMAMKFTMGLQHTQQSNDQNCPFLCPTTIDGSDAMSAWYLAAHVDPTWTVTDYAGSSFPSPLDPLRWASGTATLAVRADGTKWKVTVQDQSALDSIAQQMVMNSLQAQLGSAYADVTVTSGKNPADGAVEALSSSKIFLWRFGVLYAVGATSHHAFPKLPVANHQEQALAVTMLAGMQN